MYDESTKTMKNAPGVETRVPGFGETSTIEYLDTTGLIKYFAPMVETLVSWGYQRGETVRAAPYDFRYGPGKLHVRIYSRPHNCSALSSEKALVPQIERIPLLNRYFQFFFQNHSQNIFQN